MELQLEAHKAAIEIYRLCAKSYQAAKIEVTGIDNFRSFDLKFPYQLSDKDDPVANYSSIYASQQPGQVTYDKLRMAQGTQNRSSQRFTNFIQHKNFVDVKKDFPWRLTSIRQQELLTVSDENMESSMMVERISEEDIVEQASMVIGDYPYRPEVEEEVISWLNIINKKGNKLHYG